MNSPKLRPFVNFRVLICLLPVLVLAGCNFQIGGSDDDNDSNGNGQGDDGGASIGVLTDAGGLQIRDSDYSLAAGADVFLDGNEIDSSDLEDGMVAELTLEETVPEDLSTGTATQVIVNHLVVGPITNVQPLMVLKQEITVLEETELDGIRNDDITNLAIGDIVRVSGFTNRTGGNIATRVDVPNGGSAYWKITGTVEDLIANDSFSLEGQSIQLNGVIAECNNDLINGDFVSVTASPIPNFNDGEPIDTTLSVNCERTALPILSNDDDDIDELPAEMEGIVTEITNLSQFLLDDQEVEISNNVQFTGGEESDFILGAKIEVEGSVDPDNGVLTATNIIFHQRPIVIEAPLASSDIVVDQSVRFFGLDITTNQLVVEDDLIIASGIADQQVRLNGFVDEEQVPYAIQLSVRGASDDEDITIKGPVSDVETQGFDIMGISIEGDTAASVVNDLNEEDVVRVDNAEADGSDGVKDGDITVLTGNN